ncbi:hypothetical protein [Rodentibacter myodis]|uniref:hypothetical protein n=1 Tax=Rodentibacter myodis TaxID=1907939 RepID=UPI001ABF4ACF|nr:hypothetical protein [Rodentibacter myodis]
MLANGKLNGLMVNIDSAFDINANESAPYALVSKELWLGHIYPIVISSKRWASLSDDDKKAFERAAEIAYAQLGDMMDKNYADLLDAANAKNTLVRELTSAEVKQFAEATRYRDVQQNWAKKQEAEGVKNAQKVLQQIDRILTDSMK